MVNKGIKKIGVTSCDECPFMNYSYDDFAIGDSNSYSCNLLKMDWTEDGVIRKIPANHDYFIKHFKNGNIKSTNKKTLDNCPLLNNNLKITLK